MNSLADIGVPEGPWNTVLIILSIPITLLSDNFTLLICLGGSSQTLGSLPHSGRVSDSGLPQIHGF